MALTLSRASLYCTFLGIVIFCIFTISSYVQIHLLSSMESNEQLHFRNFTTIHSGYQGEGDVEVLAYVNSNLIVVHPDSNPNEQSEKQFHNEKPNLPLIQVPSYSKNDKQNTLSSSSSSSSTSTRSSSRTQVPAADDITQNQSINSDNNNSVTDKSNKAVIISKEILENAKNNNKETTKDTQQGSSNSKIEKGKQTAGNNNIINAKVETKKPTVTRLKSTDIQSNFTVDGWPESKSRSAEDYVNYNEPTEILLPQKPFTKILLRKDKYLAMIALYMTLLYSKRKITLKLERICHIVVKKNWAKVDKKIDDPSQPQVLVVVQSAPKNQLLREEVRRTWGHACVTIHSSWCSLVFILGNLEDPQDPLQDELEIEHNQFGDILQDSFLDSYNNLTIKSIHILKYFISVSDQIGNKYLLKTDDDSFIHLEALWDLAKFRLAKNSNHLIGYLQLGLKKHHYLPLAHKPTSGNLKKTTWRRWLIPTYMYTKKFFPQFLSGSGYLVNRQASECLLEKSKTVPIVHLEDVYITGLCAASCHLRREHNKGFKARKMEKPPLSQYQIQLSDVVIHYSTGQMDRLYNQTLQLKKDDSEFLTMD